MSYQLYPQYDLTWLKVLDLSRTNLQKMQIIIQNPRHQSHSCNEHLIACYGSLDISFCHEVLELILQ